MRCTARPRRLRRPIVVVAVLGLTGCGGESGGGEGGSDGAPPGATCSAARGPHTGEATFYDADGTGNCSFEASPDLRVAAINTVDYAGAAWCGGCVAVRGPDGEVVVRIVDRCPGCAEGDLDLSREAFAAIAPLAAGRVAISWRPVACEVSGPLAYHFKDGSNPFWTAIQVRNHRYPIAALEVQQEDGTYRSLPRLEYNYFVATDGLGAGPYALRVTDRHGQTVTDDGIALGDAVARTGSAQLPVCTE